MIVERNKRNEEIVKHTIPLNTGRKLNVHNTSQTCAGHLMQVRFTSCIKGG